MDETSVINLCIIIVKLQNFRLRNSETPKAKCSSLLAQRRGGCDENKGRCCDRAIPSKKVRDKVAEINTPEGVETVKSVNRAGGPDGVGIAPLPL